jgi:hypothetical protein
LLARREPNPVVADSHLDAVVSGASSMATLPA